MDGTETFPSDTLIFGFGPISYPGASGAVNIALTTEAIDLPNLPQKTTVGTSPPTSWQLTFDPQ
jgi:hypothetical protein